MNSNYGKSTHYESTKGAEYFAWQNQGEDLHGKLNAWKFLPWITAADDVLDFGCGGGWLGRELPGRSKAGVELNSAAHPVCAKNGIEVYPDVASIPANRKFTRIISHHCLEHVPYPIEALRELRKHLSDDGLLIFVLPVDDWRVQRDFTGKDIDHHLQTWSPRLFANTLAEAGYECINAEVLTHAWPFKWQKLHAILPAPLFTLSCNFWGWLKNRRQLRAVARIAR